MLGGENQGSWVDTGRAVLLAGKMQGMRVLGSRMVIPGGLRASRQIAASSAQRLMPGLSAASKGVSRGRNGCSVVIRGTRGRRLLRSGCSEVMAAGRLGVPAMHAVFVYDSHC
jgi:hypothetical protein